MIACRVAVWDVLAQSVRPGSMDADIRLETAEANDFKAFFAVHRSVELICFNGQKAALLFRKLVEPQQISSLPRLETLPSTSPAHASMSVAEKLSIWRSVIC